mmetsp:Transcript_59435/g.173943  ORF Transcript_59435/g.173943 Transcript_59435/m.173943 type:complete len:215 (+) Transcript_59435:528-1172(+)
MRPRLPTLPARTVPRARPMRQRTSGRPLPLQRLRSISKRFCCSRAAANACTVCRSMAIGVFHQAMMPSPMYSPTMPSYRMMMLLISSKYSLRRSMNTSGFNFSPMVVKFAMSLKKIVTSAFWTPSSACTLPLTRSSTTCGSTYFAKDCRPIDMLAKAWRISTSSVTGSEQRPQRLALSLRESASESRLLLSLPPTLSSSSSWPPSAVSLTAAAS